MEMGIAILALSFGVAAVVIAVAVDVRTRRATRELARELVALRARIGGDADLRDQRSEAGGDRRASDVRAEALADRVAMLETRLREALERRAAVAATLEQAPPLDLGDRVVLGLRHRGYQRVVVLDVREDGDVLVEAERDGVFAKGLARIRGDGAVELEAVSSVRAFP